LLGFGLYVFLRCPEEVFNTYPKHTGIQDLQDTNKKSFTLKRSEEQTGFDYTEN